MPPEVELDLRLVGQLSDADRALGRLSGAERTLPNPRLLTRALVNREAVLSSRIEGTRASVADLVLYEAEPRRGNQDVREVHNYVAAIDHVLHPQRRLPLSLGLLREAHAILLTDVRGGYSTPGEFRRSQNWIGRPGCSLADATYVPPPPERLWACLDAFEKHLHAEGTLPPLVAIGCTHYQSRRSTPLSTETGASVVC